MAALPSTGAVEQALDEYDELGGDAFLAKYGYGPAKRYFVERDGKLYDSKAIYGVAAQWGREGDPFRPSRRRGAARCRPQDRHW